MSDSIASVRGVHACGGCLGDNKTAFCSICQQEVPDEYRESIESSILRVLSKESAELKNALVNMSLNQIVIELPEWDKLSAALAIMNFDESLRLANSLVDNYTTLINSRSDNLYAKDKARTQEIRTAPVHTLGNPTITGYNLKLSTYPLSRSSSSSPYMPSRSTK